MYYVFTTDSQSKNLLILNLWIRNTLKMRLEWVPVIFCHFILSNLLINTKHTQYYYSISVKSSLINSNNNEIMMIMMIIVIIIVVELLIVILKIIMIMLLQCCILLINREWSHYREISDCGLDVLLGQYIKGEVWDFPVRTEWTRLISYLLLLWPFHNGPEPAIN